LTTWSDEALFEQYAATKLDKFFDEIVARFDLPLRKLLRFRAFHPNLIDDVLQYTWFKLFLHSKCPDNLQNWLFAVANNYAAKQNQNRLAVLSELDCVYD